MDRDRANHLKLFLGQRLKEGYTVILDEKIATQAEADALGLEYAEALAAVDELAEAAAAGEDRPQEADSE